MRTFWLYLSSVVIFACTASHPAATDEDPCEGRCGMLAGIVCGNCGYGFICNPQQYCEEIAAADACSMPDTADTMSGYHDAVDKDFSEVIYKDDAKHYNEAYYYNSDRKNTDEKIIPHIDYTLQKDFELPDTDLLLEQCAPIGATRQIGCGLNGKGLQQQLCTDGFWLNQEACADPDVCTNTTTGHPEPHNIDIVCGLNKRGHFMHDCVGGQWILRQPKKCEDTDQCIDGECQSAPHAVSFFCVNGHWDMGQGIPCFPFINCQAHCGVIGMNDCGNCPEGYYCSEDHYCELIEEHDIDTVPGDDDSSDVDALFFW